MVDEFEYTGCDNLEVMADAVNYNRFLVDCVADHYRAGDRVLDFGAGAGTYAEMLRGRGIEAECLEPDRTLQGILRGSGFTVVDDPALTDQRDRYDLIYSLNVLEHIKNDQEAADQLAALLKPGGRLVIYVPALEMLFTSMDHKVEHFRRYRRPQLNRIATNAGLRVLSSSYCDPVGFFATVAYKLVGNDDGSISPGSLRLYDRAFFPVSKGLHPVTRRMFGKNLLLVATKDR